jgi:hypothetical protein
MVAPASLVYDRMLPTSTANFVATVARRWIESVRSGFAQFLAIRPRSGERSYKTSQPDTERQLNQKTHTPCTRLCQDITMLKTVTPVLHFALATCVFLTMKSEVDACPFCPAPSVTLAEQVDQADVVVLAQWVRGTKRSEKSPGNTIFEIKRVTKNFKDFVQSGDQFTLPRFRSGEVGDLFLLLAEKSDDKNSTTVDWGAPVEISETGFNYVAQCPSPEVPSLKRLHFYLKFLEYPDQLIANDAFSEFANSSYKDITAVTSKLPTEKIRKWVLSKDTPIVRLGLYGLLIGLCGNAKDAEAIKGIILKEADELRIGMDGIMSGYLLLTGETGLRVLDKHKLNNSDQPISETYAAIKALRFMWQYGEGRIEPERLRQSMRQMLDRPELTDLVIADLSRWKDWSVQSKLMGIYGEGEFDVPIIKRAIVKYFLVCSEKSPDDVGIPQHAKTARQHLATLRKNDPATVAKAERFFLLK